MTDVMWHRSNSGLEHIVGTVQREGLPSSVVCHPSSDWQDAAVFISLSSRTSLSDDGCRMTDVGSDAFSDLC